MDELQEKPTKFNNLLNAAMDGHISNCFQRHTGTHFHDQRSLSSLFVQAHFQYNNDNCYEPNWFYNGPCCYVLFTYIYKITDDILAL